jgi:hypothetical protein
VVVVAVASALRGVEVALRVDRRRRECQDREADRDQQQAGENPGGSSAHHVLLAPRMVE